MVKLSPQFLTAIFIVAIWSSCAQVGAPVPPSLELPKPVSDMRATRKGDNVTLVWTAPSRITDGETIRHLGPTRVCRSLQVRMSQCDDVVAEVPASGKTTISNTSRLPQEWIKPEPGTLASYGVEVLNSNGRSAGLSNQATVPLLPALPPPQKLAIQVTPLGVQVEWDWPPNSPANTNLNFRLRIYRRDENGKSETRVGEVSWRGDAEPKFLDQGMEWEHTYFYRAAFVSTSPSGDLEVEGDDSPAVKIFVHDVFPPAVPSGLQAVFSSVGQPNFIDLTWSPNADPELAGYNIYRREAGSQPVKINSELAKIPTYRDRDIQPGNKYFYSVTAVDSRGNESLHSEEASERVPANGN